MSEYQFFYFAAVDRPLDDEQLEFMAQQSTRAEVSRWEFTNEYHFGNFRGNADEMLRRGFDVHLHYANFGVRKLAFRLPSRLPWKKQLLEKFRIESQIEWKPDKKGPGGILEICPEADAGSYAEDYWDFADLTEGLPRLREGLLDGDLRLLYIAWLACCWDEEVSEPPVPAGLGELPKELIAAAEFYEVSHDQIQAAAETAPQAPQHRNSKQAIERWIAEQKIEALQEVVRRLLDDAAGVRAETLAAIREAGLAADWPVVESTRTRGDLLRLAKSQTSRRLAKEEADRRRRREQRLAEIAADPDRVLAEVQQLVKLRSTAEYERAAECLAELREALGSRGARRATAAAQRLVKDHPTLNRLKSALRKRGLLDR